MGAFRYCRSCGHDFDVEAGVLIGERDPAGGADAQRGAGWAGTKGPAHPERRGPGLPPRNPALPPRSAPPPGVDLRRTLFPAGPQKPEPARIRKRRGPVIGNVVEVLLIVVAAMLVIGGVAYLGLQAVPQVIPGETAAPSPADTPSSAPSVQTTAPARLGVFGPTGNLGVARSFHTATALPDGRLVVVGGQDSDGRGTASVELFDPVAGTFWPSQSLGSARSLHAATTLMDGRILIAGGAAFGSAVLTCELYDPATGAFASGPRLNVGRAAPTATLLRDGRVLFTGGANADLAPIASAEIYDPATGTISPTGSMSVARDRHTATLLRDGRVLIVGGSQVRSGTPTSGLASAEIWDPATGRFTPTGSLASARLLHAATLLPGGLVLITGGGNTLLAPLAIELYDPEAGTFRPGPTMSVARLRGTATLLPEGQVLLIGGLDETSPKVVGGHASVELYDPITNQVLPTSSLPAALGAHVATLLPNGQVMVTGGLDGLGRSSAGALLYR